MKSVLFVLERVLYTNDENDAILSVKSEKLTRANLIGKTKASEKGTMLKAVGDWNKHEKYGWEFKADYIQTVSKDPLKDTFEAITCMVKSVKVLKEETGFTAVKATLSDGTEVKLSGKLSHMKNDKTVSVLGSWKQDETYGREFTVKAWDYVSEDQEGLAERAIKMIEALKEDSETFKKKVPWTEVVFYEDAIQIPDGRGGQYLYPYPGSVSMFNSLRTLLAENFDPLSVRYHSKEDPEILNIGEIDEAIQFTNVRENMAGKIAQAARRLPGSKPGMTRISGRVARILVPKDKAPYMNCLGEIHDPEFSVVPLKELVGGSSENALLFTIVKNGEPWIVWENENDQRATFMFRCTKDNYNERLQNVYDFAKADTTIKRRILHTAGAVEIFGEKPRAIVHTDLDGWKARLME